MKELNLKITNKDSHFSKGINAKKNLSIEEKEKLKVAAKEFESMLTGMMLKSMTKTTEGLFGKDNYGGDVLDVLFENEISKFITKKSSKMGVADKIYKSFTGESLLDYEEIVSEKFLGNTFGKLNSISKANSSTKKVTLNPKAVDRIKKYEDVIKSASEKYGIDKKLIQSIILTESAGNVNAKSKANAKGLMQLMDSTAKDMGVNNVWNPKENIFGGTKYLSKLLNRFDGNTNLALAAYNAGPGNVKKYNGIPPFKETKAYIKRVKHYLNNLD
ncbi:MAG: murein transglycosylase [Ignavibacteriae bacterium]|nr:MAG: murein transglycosylase [Ignavibacteriota bacterium]